MKFNKNQNTTNKLDTSSYTDELFGIKKNHRFTFSKRTDLVPEIDTNYVFDEATTLSIIMGFKYNKRVLVQGLHGTEKSSHIEQIAARLNWPCLRINLDGHIGRFDLLGKMQLFLKRKNKSLHLNKVCCRGH